MWAYSTIICNHFQKFQKIKDSKLFWNWFSLALNFPGISREWQTCRKSLNPLPDIQTSSRDPSLNSLKPLTPVFLYIINTVKHFIVARLNFREHLTILAIHGVKITKNQTPLTCFAWLFHNQSKIYQRGMVLAPCIASILKDPILVKVPWNKGSLEKS